MAERNKSLIKLSSGWINIKNNHLRVSPQTRGQSSHTFSILPPSGSNMNGAAEIHKNTFHCGSWWHLLNLSTDGNMHTKTNETLVQRFFNFNTRFQYISKYSQLKWSSCTAIRFSGTGDLFTTLWHSPKLVWKFRRLWRHCNIQITQITKSALCLFDEHRNN